MQKQSATPPQANPQNNKPSGAAMEMCRVESINAIVATPPPLPLPGEAPHHRWKTYQFTHDEPMVATLATKK